MYLGVKYIGGNASKDDTVCNSGAVWKKGEVLNFEEDSARNLAVHTDSFVLVDMSPNAKTFANKVVGAADNYEPFPSLAGMDAMQIANLASVRYGIKIDIEGRTKEDIVFDALNRIKAANLRADATDLGVKILPVVSMTVSEDEYKAYNEGKLILQLVTPETDAKVQEYFLAKLHSILPPNINIQLTNKDLDPSLNPVKKAPATKEVVMTFSGKAADDFVLPNADDGNVIAIDSAIKPNTPDELPTLTELLASLSTKKELQAFAKENNVSFANSMNETQLRTKLLRSLDK